MLLTVDVEQQIGGRPGALAATVSVSAPSEDDPQSELRFLLFDLDPFWTPAATALATLLAQ